MTLFTYHVENVILQLQLLIEVVLIVNYKNNNINDDIFSGVENSIIHFVHISMNCRK